MTRSIDTFNTQAAQFAQWIDQQTAPSILNESQKKTILDKTNLLGLSQNLASETHAILLSEIDNKNDFNTAIQHDLMMPVLSEPKSTVKDLNQSGKSVLLLSELMNLSAEMNMHELSLQLKNLLASYASYSAASDKLDESLKKLIDQAESAKKEAAEAQDKLKDLEGKCPALQDKAQALQDKAKGLQATLNKLQEQIKQKEAELQSLDNDSPEYAVELAFLNKLKEAALPVEKELSDANKAVLSAEKAVGEQQKAVDTQKAVVDGKVKEAATILKSATEELKKQSDFAAQNSGIGNTDKAKKQLTEAARLSELIGFFMQLINKNSETELESQKSVFEALQKSVQKDMENKAKEIEEKERKAEELQKTMGCIGKVIGAIITVVSVVGAVFTGGASLALAGIGLALMAGDLIAEAATGQSLTDRVMAPFMEHVFLPMMREMEKVISEVLTHTGLGELLDKIGELIGADLTSIVKTTAAALVTIAIIVAVAFVVKSGVKTIAEKLLGSVVGEAIKNIMPKVATDVVKKVGQSVTRNISKVAAKAGLKNKATAARALQANKYAQWFSYANQGAQVTSNVFVADFRKEATKMVAAFKLSQADLESIKKVLESVMSAFETSQNTYQDLAKLISDAAHKEATTGKQVLKNMRV